MVKEEFTMPEKKEEEESPDENIYDEGQRQDQLDDSEITPAEAGFMEGYEDVKLVECASCGKKVDFEKIIERKIGEETYWFCSKKCAEHFEKRKALG